MAHFSPKVAQAKRRMAHPVRRGPGGWFRAAFGDAEPGSAAAGSGGASAGLVRRFVPNAPRHRELLVVLALLVVAAVVCASLPGGLSGSAAAGSSKGPHAALVADIMASVSYTPFAPETFADPPLIPATPPPTPEPTPAPTPRPVHHYTFVALGDSLTAWPSGNPWPNRLNAEDGNLAFLYNAGVPGNTTADMLARLSNDVFAYHPEVLFILGGTNDLGRNVSEATIIANLKSIILAARAKGIRIFLILVPPDSYTNMAAPIDSLNAAITHLANIYTIVAIDIHTPLSQDNGTFQPRYTSDGLHFTDLGAQTVANAIFNRIHRLGY